MSVSPPPPTSPAAAEPGRPRRIPERPAPSRPPWAHLAVASALLAASGGARWWQEARLERAMERGRASPFPLAQIPASLGPWEGRDVAMDARLVRGSGSTDLITRRYVNRATGVNVDVVVMYGPTSDMFIHTPELCYPAAGYEASSPPAGRPIEAPGGGVVPFRSQAFTRGEGGSAETQEVYYSLWYDGRWTTATTSPKASRRIPGMYKVQASRRLAEGERRDLDNPGEPLLALLVAEIEARMAAGRPTGPPPTRPGGPAR